MPVSTSSPARVMSPTHTAGEVVLDVFEVLNGGIGERIALDQPEVVEGRQTNEEDSQGDQHRPHQHLPVMRLRLGNAEYDTSW